MSGPKSFLLQLLILGAMLLGLPLLGVLAAGEPVGRYLQFPPQTRYVRHAPFAWLAFAGCAAGILVVVLPLTIRGLRALRSQTPEVTTSHPFPWWGWVGLAGGFCAWVLAWSRFSWAVDFQPYTFVPLWLAFIVVINALCRRRTGHSLMTDRPGFFLLLFPASAAFWWFFEYLNRFVQNWYYTGVHFDPWHYFWSATLSFSTVLPAVLSTRQWMGSFGRIQRAFGSFRPIVNPYPRLLAAGVLGIAGGGLAGIALWPDFLFPLLWVSPLLIITALQSLFKAPQVFSKMAAGNWSDAIGAALAAIFCGWFWEMWNYYSLARWTYSIPLVQRFQIFEMPILGYAGYLPFGLECMAAGDMLSRLFKGRPL